MVMHEIKYGYTSAIYCEVARYRCLMPVEYQRIDGEFQKIRMVCNLVKNGKCNQSTECPHFKLAPKVMDEYLLNEKK